MTRTLHCWLLVAVVTTLLFASVTAQGGNDAREHVQRQLREATDDYARGELESAWFRFWALAREGNAAAQFNLGQLYRQGHGIPPDLEQARHWYEAAAAQGYAYAQYNLGIMYEFGRGTEGSTAEARRWYRRAAAQNLPEAQRALSRLESRQGNSNQAPVAQVPR
jgi:TPR repeat protein